jgi:cellulose biosynthesis protein BcsQ
MIVTILGENNRVGKSILAINLAALRAHHGGKVLLIDGDSHKCPFIWSVRRDNAGMKLKVPVLPVLGNSLYSELEHIGPRYRDIVIDAGKADFVDTKTALVAAKTAIIPIQPRQGDLKSEERLIKCIETAKLFNPCLRTLVVITQALDSASVQDHAAARAFVEKIPSATVANTIIHDFTSIDNAFKRGLSVLEYQPSDEAATTEMERLYQEIYKDENSASGIAACISAAASRVRGLYAVGGARTRS